SRGMHVHRHVRIEAADCGRAALDLARPDVGRAMNHLPLQIGERDAVVVDDPDRADARRRQIKQRGCAEPPCPNDQDPGALERSLPRSADFTEHDVAGVTLELVRTQHVLSLAARSSAKAKALQCQAVTIALAKPYSVAML